MSKTIICDIKNNRFSPLTIKRNTYVVWNNLDSIPHSAETLPGSKDYFNAGPLFPGEMSSPVYFSKEGEFSYICRFHAGMAGSVKVTDLDSTEDETNQENPHDSHNHHHGKHFHGFVTGGRSSKQMFLTHTPVLADTRHHFQVILQASLPNPVHAASYDALRNSSYGNGKIQIFHDHMALTDIRDGKQKVLPKSSFEYYPNDPEGIAGGVGIPGLEENIPVQIDKIIHFHTFEKDIDYPDAITYLIYGNEDDVFIDHLINRAPSFHSVAKLKDCPDFYNGELIGEAVKFSVTEKHIIDVSPKQLQRVSFVDNSFHLFWLPPPGVYARSLAQDPLIRRDNSKPIYDIITDKGQKSQIEIERFLHFDVRLLNYGVLIV